MTNCPYCKYMVGDIEHDPLKDVGIKRVHDAAHKAERAAIIKEIRRQAQRWEAAGITDLLVRYNRLANSIQAGEHHA